MGDLRSHGLGSRKQRGAVIAVPELRLHGSQRTSGKTVGDVRFNSAAGFDIVLVILYRQQKQDALIILPRTDPPSTCDFKRDIANGLIVDRIDRHQRKLHTQLLLYFGAKLFKRLLLIGRQDIGKIADIASRLGKL